MSQLCPCGHPKPFEACCGPAITDSEMAATPEALMRSRYSAFVTRNADYLVATHHQSTLPPNLKMDLEKSFAQSQWRSLRILDSSHGKDRGTVTFVAFFQTVGPSDELQQLHEKSEFIKEGGRWYYVQGKHLPDLKIGRNDLCWCNSGKKFKKCHG